MKRPVGDLFCGSMAIIVWCVLCDCRSYKNALRNEELPECVFILFFLLSVDRFLFSYRFDNEGKSLVGIWNPVFSERPGPPRVNTAETHLTVGNMYGSEGAGRQIS